jgi:hypothetical protein
MAAGSTWTITATVTLRDTVNPSDVYTNPADVSFTSLPGANGTANATPGAAGAATGERTGADGIGGALNDYALADTEGLSIPNPFNVTKSADKTTVKDRRNRDLHGAMSRSLKARRRTLCLMTPCLPAWSSWPTVRP